MTCAIIERFSIPLVFLARSCHVNQNKINGKITKPKTILKIANHFGIRWPARLMLNSLIQSYRINKNSVIPTKRIGKITSVKKFYMIYSVPKYDILSPKQTFD